LWYGRLTHVSIASIKRHRKLELIPMIKIDDFSKYFVCVETKHAKKPLEYIISTKTELLELIYSNLTSFKNTVRKSRKKYYFFRLLF